MKLVIKNARLVTLYPENDADEALLTMWIKENAKPRRVSMTRLSGKYGSMSIEFEPNEAEA